MRARRRKSWIAIAVSSATVAPRAFASNTFTAAITTGNIQNSAITEASGIAASRANPNVLWTQEDSGNPAQLYAMTPAGANLGTYVFSGAGNTDWEDIALGPGPSAGVSYLYAGDIGDNNWDNASHRNAIAVYRVPEPAVSDMQSNVAATLTGVSKFTFAYPDGAHDAESMFVDPLTRDLYIITKRDSTFKYVYRAAYPQSTSGTTTLTLAATLTNGSTLTGAAISPDGSQILIRAYLTSSGLMYTRPAGGSVADAFATAPVSVPIGSEIQGEAIGFDPNGWGYYTTSEGTSAPIRYYNRLPPPGQAMYWDTDTVAAGSYLTSGAGLGGGGGTWDTSAGKWYNGSANVAWVDGNDAVFWGSVAGSITLSAARSVNSLTFKTTGYTIAGSTLTLSNPNVTVDAGVTATIGSVVGGSSGLVKNGAGTLVLTNSSNQTSGYTGGTIVNAGTLLVASGTLSRSGGGVTINNGAALAFTGSFTLASSRAVTLGSGAGGIIDSGAGSIEIAGVVSGSGGLTKSGAGTLTLTNTNTYAGPTAVAAGTLVMTNTFTGSASVSVDSGATLSIPAANAAVLKTGSVSAAGSGKVDLTNNKLIVTAQDVAAVTALISSGRNGGAWNGGGLITSSASDNLTSLGVATASEAGKSTFGGISVEAGNVLVMYTYAGDANLDGKINVDDYGRIDFNANLPGVAGWYNGDFNYDGKINVDDYGIIDFNVGIQGPPLAGVANPATLAAVPEPVGGAAALAIMVLCCPRRRGKSRCASPSRR